MNVFAVLKKDHQAVSEIMRKLQQTGDRSKKAREELFTRLRTELEAHARGEEEVFYACLEEFDETRDLVAEAREEHEEMKRFLDELAEMSTDDEEWKGKLELLMEAVDHHVQEEEGEMFQAAKEVLGREQIETLAEEFSEAKKQALEG